MSENPRYSDDDFVHIVAEERRRSIGFGEAESGELIAAREKALKYYQGVMADVPTMENRSQAVSTDVAEAVETLLPDLIEIFVGGDDVASFAPHGPEDEDAAEQETDFVKHVVMSENAGFLALYTAFKDALLTRTGVLHWWWESGEEINEEMFEGQTPEQLAYLQSIADQEGISIEDIAQDEYGISYTVRQVKDKGKLCLKAFPSEDFTVARDTVLLRDTTYCAVKARPRVQELIARGVDPDVARELPAYVFRNDVLAQSRDEAGENDRTTSDGHWDLKTVEVREHYIRLDAEGDGTLSLWQVVTDCEDRRLIHKQKVNSIPFAALTPYINAHRFYGESVADKLLEIQRIKTALLRMMLDSGYFALNQRMEVSMADANEWTVADLIRNQPNVPVRSKTGNAVKPLSAGALNFDVFAAMEHVSVMGELRTGVMRNAQGLNPETLHDTAHGAMALLNAAQKRVRLIARVFAETGIKDMFLGVHEMLRENATQAATVRLRGKWVQVDPTKWGERSDMDIQVGLGSSGREADLATLQMLMQAQQEVVTLQGGIQGPLVTADNAYNLLKRITEKAGQKSPELFWSDPSDPQNPANTAPPKPDPKILEVQAKAQLAQQQQQDAAQHAQMSAQLDAQVRASEAQSKSEGEQARAAADVQISQQKMAMEAQLRREQIAQELGLKREIAMLELQHKHEIAQMQIHANHAIGQQKIDAMADAKSSNDVHPGGEPG